MGNETGAMDRNDKQFEKELNFLKRRSNESMLEEGCSDLRFEQVPDKKWRQDLLRALKNKVIAMKRTNDDLCNDLRDIILSIRQDSFLKAIAHLNSIVSSEARVIDSKRLLKQTFVGKLQESHYTPNVKIQIDSRFWKNHEGNDSVSTGSMSSTPQKSVVKPCKYKANIQSILSRQINQEFHPVKTLKDSFIMMLKMKYRTRVDEAPLNKKEQRVSILEDIHEDITFYCQFVSEGCEIYKKWILRESGVKETRYKEFVKRIILESLFSGVSLEEELFPLVKQICNKDLETLVDKLPQHIDVKKFCIKPDLAIEGAFMNSLMLLSDFDRIQSPKKCMESLTLLRDQICYDIDQYHKVFGTEKNFKIDGQNILSITCFLLCRMKPKMTEIYTQLNLLNVIFGDDAAIFFSEGSYLLTTCLAGFEYLTSQTFLGNL